MNRQLDELLLRRGRLLERIARQREVLRDDFVPVSAALGKADSAVAGVRSFVDTIRRHPIVTTVVAASVVMFKGKPCCAGLERASRSGRRGESCKEPYRNWEAVPASDSAPPWPGG